jgi:hypothetical protein
LCWWEAPVVTGPEEQMAAGAAARGRLRASDGDREQVIDTLKAAFVQGWLTKDELSMRAGQVLASRTYAELSAITADIPATLTDAQLPPEPAQVRAWKPINKKVVAWGAVVIIVSPALGAAFLTYYGGFIVLFLFAFIGLTVTAEH